jgi:hypothetical protein
MKKPMIPSSRPCDVAYRIKRYNELLEQAAEFLYAIDPGLEPSHRDAQAALRHARHAAALLVAPAKKPRRSPLLDG